MQQTAAQGLIFCALLVGEDGGRLGDGTLRFVGAHHVSNLPRCGVELDQPGGKNNGTVKGYHPPPPLLL